MILAWVELVTQALPGTWISWRVSLHFIPAYTMQGPQAVKKVYIQLMGVHFVSFMLLHLEDVYLRGVEVG